ncbi:PKD domain-containing protein [Roseateles sp. UC29_93]|uniref:PKD domain-containing protein n=1 Tax=Roseateles sp. UC29_93 TaxID=3350177 RepID=UPI00367089E3
MYSASVPSGTVLRFAADVRATALSESSKPVPGDFSYSWTFGDGSTADTPWVERVFTTAGSFPVSLKVSDTANRSLSSNTNRITVRPVQVDPLSIIVGGPGMRDGGPVARFDTPVALMPTTDGGMLVLDKGNSVIRRIADGVVSTVVGAPSMPGYQLGKAGIGRLEAPVAFTRDVRGTIYVADAYRLVKVASDGSVDAVAGGSYMGNLDDTTSGVPWARAIAATPEGDLYVAGTNTIRLLKGGVATLVAGSASSSGAADGSAAQARFNDIRALALGSDGALWIQDGCTRLRRLTRDGRVETVSGAGAPDYGVRCGSGIATAPEGDVYFATATDVKRVRPDGTTQAAVFAAGVDAVAVDTAGRVYTARADEHTVSRHEVGALITFGLSPKSSGSFPAALQDLTAFAPVRKFAVHPNGDVYFIDRARLCRVRPPIGDVTCVAGRTGEERPVDGTPIVARLSGWTDADVTVDRAGIVYFSDQQTLRRYEPDTGDIRTIAGTPPFLPQVGVPPATGQVEDADGDGTAAALRNPFSLATDSKGNVYAIANGGRVIRVSPTGTVTTLARHTVANWPLYRLLVGPDDQVYALSGEALFKVVDGGTMSRSEWPGNPQLGSGYAGGAAVVGPDGAIWALASNGYGQRYASTWLERITSTERRAALFFGPIRRQIVSGMPDHEFNPGFIGMAIDPQGRLVLSDAKQFGFWRLSEPASPTL